jgi:hypothetical protein
MATKQRFKILDVFRDASMQLQAFLQTKPDLNDTEQLCIENCIMMTQITYQQWGDGKYKEKRLTRRKPGKPPSSS